MNKGSLCVLVPMCQAESKEEAEKYCVGYAESEVARQICKWCDDKTHYCSCEG